MTKDNGRAINILLCVAGVLCCVGSGFVSAPKGLLADESVSMVQAMDLPRMLIFYAVPAALMLAACVLVILGKMDILSLLCVLAAAILSAMMDFQYGVRHQMFSGVLLNMIGVILMAAGVALQVFATETGPARVSRKAAKSRNPKEFRYERSKRPAYDDIYMDMMNQPQQADTSDGEMSESDKYRALEAAAAEEMEAAEAQKAQEDEIEAMLKALSTEPPAHDKAADTAADALADDEDPETADTEVKSEAESSVMDSDSEIEDLLAEMRAAEEKEAENLTGNKQTEASTIAMAKMADALETPNQTMTDFYAGIEEIFLDQDDQ